MKTSRWRSWLKSFLVRYKRQVAFAIGLGLLASACSALLMFTSGYLISATALASTTLFSVMVPVACVQLFGLGRPFARYAERLASHDWVLRLTSDLRLSLFRSIEARTGDPELEGAAGEYLGLLSDDVAHLQNLYLRVVFPSVVAYLLALLASALFGFFSPLFAGAMLVSLAVVTVLVPFASLLATRAGVERAKAEKAGLSVALVDDVSGSVDWVLAGRGGEALAQHARRDGDVRRAESSTRMRQRSFALALALLLGMVLFAIVAWAGEEMGGSPSTANWIAAFALGFFPLIEAFSILPSAFSESTTHRESIARLDEYLSRPSSAALAGLPMAAEGHAVEVAALTYTYPRASKPALDGIDLEIEAGSKTAVLGRSGSGKSTLVKLVCGDLRPDSGEIRVAGRIGLLGQDPYLFNRSLRDNLAIGAGSASDEELAGVLADVGLSAKLSSLPHSLDTIVGETGIGFSGGEAHRVALARVLAADAPVIVVDEPFSALDPETERDLLDTLFESCRDKTLLVVTHHLALIERFDRVIFIEDGRVDLDGSPAALMRESERFRTLVAFDRA